MSKEEVILVHFSLAGMCFVTGEWQHEERF
jgi:hypothetical protein